MKNSIIARRYGDAFISLARATIGIEQAVKEANTLKRILKESEEFNIFFASPQISRPEKTRFIDDILKNDFSEDMRNFLKLLINKGRMDYFVGIADHIRETYSHEDVVNVVLKTTFFLDNALIQKVQNKLQEKLQKKMNFYINLAPELCGGIQVIIGNKIIDGSVKYRLNELKKKLKAIEVF
ncbi:MAG: ATP synthase F1 subunit delta [Candidatus Omnitrophica bacterium]|nr:ATP synthase F1 subunit delta [Candidatus Omnitrophota bacterium]